MGRRRAIRRGNIIAARLDQRLSDLGWGSLLELLAKLHQLAGEPGYSELGEMTLETLSRIRHGRRPCFDYELVAISSCLNTSMYWLCGLTDDPMPPPGVRRLL